MDSAHKKAKHSRRVKRKAEFGRHRSLRKSLYRRDHQLYIESLEAAASEQPAAFCMYVRGRSKASKEHISLLNSDGKQVEDVAAIYAQYFHFIFQLSDANERLSFNNMSNFNTLLFDEKLVNYSEKQMKR